MLITKGGISRNIDDKNAAVYIANGYTAVTGQGVDENGVDKDAGKAKTAKATARNKRRQ